MRQHPNISVSESTISLITKKINSIKQTSLQLNAISSKNSIKIIKH